MTLGEKKNGNKLSSLEKGENRLHGRDETVLLTEKMAWISCGTKQQTSQDTKIRFLSRTTDENKFRSVDRLNMKEKL